MDFKISKREKKKFWMEFKISKKEKIFEYFLNKSIY